MSASQSDQAFGRRRMGLPTKLSTGTVEKNKSRAKSSTYRSNVNFLASASGPVDERAAALSETIVHVLVDAPRHAGSAARTELPESAPARARNLGSCAVRSTRGRRSGLAERACRGPRRAGAARRHRRLRRHAGAERATGARWSNSPRRTTSAASARSRSRRCRRSCAARPDRAGRSRAPPAQGARRRSEARRAEPRRCRARAAADRARRPRR